MKPKLPIFVTVLSFTLGLLSISAGIPKLLQMPQELGFLSNIGIEGIAVSVLGIWQLLGGILLFPRKVRLMGVSLTGLAFIISSVAIFAGGNTVFGLVSLLPILVALAVAYFTLRAVKDAV